MSEEFQQEQLANLSLMNILAAAVITSKNHLELSIDLVLEDFSSKNLVLGYNEDTRKIILELIEIGETDESGQISQEPA